MPLMLRQKQLTVVPGDPEGNPIRKLQVCAQRMPALQHVDGVECLPDNLPGFTALTYLRLYRCGELPETTVGGSKSLLHLVIEEHNDEEDFPRLPGWFTGDAFPNMHTLKFDFFVDFPWVQPCIASIATLTELDLLNMVCFDTAIKTVIDPSVFQIRSLRVLKMTGCDFSTLPPMFLPSLEFLYITRCEELYELLEFVPNALPKLVLMHLNALSSIREEEKLFIGIQMEDQV